MRMKPETVGSDSPSALALLFVYDFISPGNLESVGTFGDILDFCFLFESGVNCCGMFEAIIKEILLGVLGNYGGIRYKTIDVCT